MKVIVAATLYFFAVFMADEGMGALWVLFGAIAGYLIACDTWRGR